jgi:membrane fusion protein (multidrug efflux system)
MKFKNIQITMAIIFIVSTMIVACGEKGSSIDKKKAELEKVRKEIAELQIKEKTLVSEIGETTTKDKLVEIQTIKKQAFSSDLKVEGTIDADQSTIATAKVPGTVMNINIEVGSRVSKGQILASLDNSSALKGKLELEQQVAFATTVYEKQRRLWEKGVGTEIQYLSAKNQKDALEKSLSTLNNNIDMYNVKSPINGTIEAVDVKIGQITAPGMPIFKVVNMSSIKVVANISEAYADKVSVGDIVTVELPDINQTIKAKVTFASNFIDPLNRTFRVEVKMNGIKDVKPNMVAKLNIEDYVNPKALVVPSNAIQRNENETFIMIAKIENKKTIAEKRNIIIGKANQDLTEVLSGIEENETIIVNGFQELTTGQVVKPTNVPTK